MPKFINAISNKSDGNMSFRYGPSDDILQNRTTFLLNHKVAPDDCVAMSLQNGDECITVTEKDKGRGMKAFDGIVADCLITKEKEVFLFAFVGDCLPLTIYDTGAPIVALAHISRHNASKQFIKKFWPPSSNFQPQIPNALCAISDHASAKNRTYCRRPCPSRPIRSGIHSQNRNPTGTCPWIWRA